MPEITWGDSVRVKAGAPSAVRPGALAAVCGIREIANDGQASESDAPIGSKLYLVEFGDGTSLEIPEAWVVAAST